MALNISKTILKTSKFIHGSKRFIQTTASLTDKKFNIPPSGNELQRPAGVASFCRLPVQATTEGG